MFYVTATVNTPSKEYDYKITHENDLTALMKRIRQHHPSATSVVLSIVWNDNTQIEI